MAMMMMMGMKREWTGGMEDSGAAKCSAAAAIAAVAAAIEAAIVNFPLARPLALLINFFDEMRGGEEANWTELSEEVV